MVRNAILIGSHKAKDLPSVNGKREEPDPTVLEKGPKEEEVFGYFQEIELYTT